MKVIHYSATPQIKEAIANLGRTEDVRFSPDERCLAIVENKTNTIHFFEISIKGAGSEQAIELGAHTAIISDDLDYPHGIDFLDNSHFVVANRMGDLVCFKLPSNLFIKNKIELYPAAIAQEKKLFGISSAQITSPGSVHSYKISKNCYRILVCNNYQDNVISFIADLSIDPTLKNEGVLIQKHLSLPDGIDVSPGGRYVAVSCHETLNVLIYKSTILLNKYSPPKAILSDIGCPHGLRFSADGKRIFVADAGTQFLHVFYSKDGEWNDTVYAEKTLKIVDDVVFTNSRLSPTGTIYPEEGGLKGLDFANHDQLLATTAEGQVLRFFSTDTLMNEQSSTDDIDLLDAQVHELRLFQENKRHIKIKSKADKKKESLKLLKKVAKRVLMIK